jgi:hypothetical protein
VPSDAFRRAVGELFAERVAIVRSSVEDGQIWDELLSPKPVPALIFLLIHGGVYRRRFVEPLLKSVLSISDRHIELLLEAFGSLPRRGLDAEVADRIPGLLVGADPDDYYRVLTLVDYLQLPKALEALRATALNSESTEVRAEVIPHLDGAAEQWT